ncbi:MAG TPA: winged helix-turn-helix domain-containing protein, partial [Chloroflexota bacterium]|nr:winged helix-turn-helix domain-containing protein [Chloroflexota bacterium]
ARIEQLVGISAAPTGPQESLRRADDDRPTTLAGSDLGIKDFSTWLKTRHRPGHTYVVAGFIRDNASWSASRSWKGTGAQFDFKAVAAVCHALASEARLGILRELSKGRQTTADLVSLVGLDRGQLYHHLRDLFLQGLVEQPERGLYAVTARGLSAFHLSSLFLNIGYPHETTGITGAAALELDDEEPGVTDTTDGESLLGRESDAS